NTSGAKPASTSTSSSGGNCGALDVGCHLGKVAGFFTTGLGDLVKNIITFVLQTLGQAIGGNSKTTAYLDPPKTTAEAYERFGALGAIGLTVDDMYANPPLSTVDYLATINPIVPIFAQDPNKTPGGGDVLSANGPIGLFWKASRNLAYIAFVLILVTIGFMLMFRSKLDPRTTVTVTAALPNLVVSMVLITFSLAFAALLVDAGKLLEEVVKAVINGSLTNNDVLVRADRQIGLSVGSVWNAFVFDNSNSLSLGNGSEIVSAFVNLVILIFGFFVGLQVFIMLLTRYVSILVKPIFAPLTFLIGALPGKGHVAGAWFKGYLVDVLTFPVVLFILNLASSIKYGAALSTQGDPFGLLAPGSNLAGLAALGVLIFATKVPAMLEDALDAHPSKTVSGAGLQAKDVTKQIPIVKNLL
ncbi:MAG TPA: hypothetical protein VFK94_05085, partial [Patescibacteria group bacterium]|nr:hypothetical protein [Patescibacteria group bacterium]